MKTKALGITNVSAGPRSGEDMVCLSCVHKGARYHFWLNVASGDHGDVVYKNPIASERGGKTLTLRANTGPMQALIAAMLEVYHREGLLQKFNEKEAKEEAERLEKAHQEWARQVKQEAGEDLYNVLKVLLDAIAHGHNTDQDVEAARVVLAKIDKKIKE